MKMMIKSALGAFGALAAMTTQASAEVCLLFICLGGGGGGGGGYDDGGAPAAPEIDVTQGFAALAVLICAALILRERFMRQRPQR